MGSVPPTRTLPIPIARHIKFLGCSLVYRTLAIFFIPSLGTELQHQRHHYQLLPRTTHHQLQQQQLLMSYSTTPPQQLSPPSFEPLAYYYVEWRHIITVPMPSRNFAHPPTTSHYSSSDYNVHHPTTHPHPPSPAFSCSSSSSCCYKYRWYGVVDFIDWMDDAWDNNKGIVFRCPQ